MYSPGVIVVKSVTPSIVTAPLASSLLIETAGGNTTPITFTVTDTLSASAKYSFSGQEINTSNVMVLPCKGLAFRDSASSVYTNSEAPSVLVTPVIAALIAVSKSSLLIASFNSTSAITAFVVLITACCLASVTNTLAVTETAGYLSSPFHVTVNSFSASIFSSDGGVIVHASLLITSSASDSEPATIAE